MKKLLPVLIALIGLGGGVFGGAMLKPAPEMTEHADAKGHDKAKDADAEHGEEHAEEEFVYANLKKPFFVPVAQPGQRNMIVRLDIHLEVPEALSEKVTMQEPKLRDAFLRTVMNFSHEGGFARVKGGEGFIILRDDLLLSARAVLGQDVKNVLIGEILTRAS
jgi:flagellar basal body-associated protein FliL